MLLVLLVLLVLLSMLSMLSMLALSSRSILESCRTGLSLVLCST